jgi:BRO family, N-terminal domain/Poxvirus D5 protein-like
MNEIAVFDFEENTVRSVMIDGDPWFVGKDVCRCLGIVDHNQALERIDEDERLDGYNIPTQSERGGRTAIVVSEPGVYRLIFTSRTEAAERFKRWLAHDVLPSIRKSGKYVAPQLRQPAMDDVTPLGDLDFDDLRRAAPVLREWRLLYGKAAARVLARRLPVPQVSIPELAAEDRDDAGEFSAEMLVRAQGALTSAAEIYAAYIEWCGENETRPMSQTAFGRRLAELGWKKDRTGGRVRYLDAAIDHPASRNSTG